jgi:sugar phosphate isomerase/epimerase
MSEPVGMSLMKTALHSVSYAGLWPGQALLSLDQFLVRARDLGFAAVMLMAKRPHLSVLDMDSDSRRQLRQRLHGLKLQVACLAGYTDFCLGLERPGVPTLELQLLYVRELSQLAHDLDCKLVRIFTGFERADISYDTQWQTCVRALQESASVAARFGVTIGVQNHHDVGGHWEALLDLLAEVAAPNCKAMFDAWAPALQGCDLVASARAMAPHMVHTTVADYVRRPRFHYQPNLVNYQREDDVIRAVPMGEGFIDYRAFLKTLQEAGYEGHVAYEMCSPLRGGGGEANLDRCARRFLEYMASI